MKRATFSLVIGAVLGLTGCGAAVSDEPTTPTPAAAVATPAIRTPAPVVNTDAEVCGDLERLGESFYTETFAPMLMQSSDAVSLDVQPIELSVQLAVLTTIGAAPGEINGAETIANTSPTVRAPMITMVQDADRLAERFAAASVSGVLSSSDVTAIVTSFAEALVACSTAGHSPAWFDPVGLSQ